MGLLGKVAGTVSDKLLFRKDNNNDNRTITDAQESDPKAIAEQSGAAGKMLIKALDKAVHLQASAITGYVDWLRSQHPEASPEQIQNIMNKHFVRVVTGTGAGAGGAAAIPGIGFITGAAAIAAESLAFLDAAAFYTVASGHLRGADIRDPERRKALILIAVLGSEGSALVDASLSAGSSVAAVSRMSARNLTTVNNRMLRLAMKQVSKRMKYAWAGKIMPLGIGVVVGTMANRKIAQKVIGSTQESLGPLPQRFDHKAPSADEVQEPETLLAKGQHDDTTTETS